jgi:hypothetical protein
VINGSLSSFFGRFPGLAVIGLMVSESVGFLSTNGLLF